MKKEKVKQRSTGTKITCLFLFYFLLVYIEMEDLLSTFQDPCIMDCKIGVRTYLEEDLDKSERDPEPRAVLNVMDLLAMRLSTV